VQASRSPTVISVALQLPASEKNVRLTQKFASNTSLWEILRHFESGQEANYNFTQRGVPEMSGASGAGRLHHETPVITVMPGHREQSDFVGLQQTLVQLGFDSGSALLKLSYKNSGMPLEEAMAQISQYFRRDSPESAGGDGAHTATFSQSTLEHPPEQAVPEATTTVAGDTIRDDEPGPEHIEIDEGSTIQPTLEPDASTKSATTENVGDVSPTPSLTAAISTVSEPTANTPAVFSVPSLPSALPRNVQIFSASTSSTPQAARNPFNESDYLPTIEHAKVHQNQLTNKTRNQRLASDKELEEAEKAKQEKMEVAAARGGALRLRMPDGTLIQMNFTKEDTAGGLYDFAQGFLDRKNEPFELKYTSQTGRLVLIEKNSKRLMKDLRFSINELITFQWAENASAEARASRKTLAEEWQAKATALKVEELVPEKPQASTERQTVAEGKRKVEMSASDKENKLKNILGKGFFKRK
jgi:tether containing UBX domain for GLUT4